MRRVVTANNDDGLSSVAFDGEPPTRFQFGANSVVQLWALAGDGSDSGHIDPTIDLALSTDLPAGASRWILLEFGPGVDERVHATQTVDLAYVIDGQITVVLDREETVLHGGDILVQHGARHGWRNDGTEPCRLLIHVVSAKP